MHRVFATMGGLPRRAPVPATIALLTPPAPPPPGPNQKKPASQGPPAGHKCSRCKTRPKSGSGSSLCIRCKLQREYGSPRGGFAAPRKKIPSAAQHSHMPPIHVAASSSATTPADATASTSTQASNSVADVVSQLKVEERVQPVETIHLEVAGEPSLKIDRSKLRSHPVLTESDWSSLKEELENEKDDFLPEDLDQTIEVDLLSGQSSAVNVALPAEILGAIEAAGSSVPRAGISCPPPVLSLPELSQVGIPALPNARSPPVEPLSPTLLEDARESIRLYRPLMEAAFDALNASASQAKWVTVLSVYQKKDVLAKIFERLAELERKLLPPGELNAYNRISRSMEQLFTSMNLLRGQMQAPGQQNDNDHDNVDCVNNDSNNNHNNSSNNNGNDTIDSTGPVNVNTAPQMPEFQPLNQNTSNFCDRQREQGPFPYTPTTTPTEQHSNASFQTAKSLKDEADEEIKKILAKLQSEDRNVVFPSVLEQTSQIYGEPSAETVVSQQQQQQQQQPVNRTMFAPSNGFGIQLATVSGSFQESAAPSYGQMNGQSSPYQVQGMNMWATPLVPNTSGKNCTSTNASLVNRTAIRSTGLVDSAMHTETFGSPPVKRAFLEQGRQDCPPQMSSVSMVSAPQLRNLLARKVSPSSAGRATSGQAQQNHNYYGSGRLNHAQSQEQQTPGFMNPLDACNRKPTSSLNTASLAHSASNFPGGNTYSQIYAGRGQIVQQQPQQYHVQTHPNGPLLSISQNSGGLLQVDSQPSGPQNGRGPLQGLAIHPQLQQVDQVISSEPFPSQWSGSNLGVFNLRG